MEDFERAKPSSCLNRGNEIRSGVAAFGAGYPTIEERLASMKHKLTTIAVLALATLAWSGQAEARDWYVSINRGKGKKGTKERHNRAGEHYWGIFG